MQSPRNHLHFYDVAITTPALPPLLLRKLDDHIHYAQNCTRSLNFGRNLPTLSSVHRISMKFASSLEKNIAFRGNAQSDSKKCGNYLKIVK